jgi:NAD(P)H-dependent flavin oxidoreductase YrpB (nitropropane dioxygenase family)
MLHTPICDYFGIKYPILLAGMGGVAMHKLVAAISNAGGLGVIGAASLSPDLLRAEIRKNSPTNRSRSICSLPFPT